MKKLVLVDGNSFIFRAYYATAYKQNDLMKNSEGQEINALIVFMKMFQKIWRQADQYICVAFDSAKKTMRHTLYPDYKKGRPPIPHALISQITLVQEYLKLFGVFYHHQEGYEADDIIGTIAKQASNNQIPVLIFSSDKDFLQLIDQNINIHLIKKNFHQCVIYDIDKLQKEYQLAPSQIIDFKSLVGDPSDNIQGVPRIGPKTAIKLLKQFRHLENIFASLPQIETKIKNNLILYKDQVFFNRILTQINLKVPLTFDYTQTQKNITNKEALNKFLNKNKLEILKPQI